MRKRTRTDITRKQVLDIINTLVDTETRITGFSLNEEAFQSILDDYMKCQFGEIISLEEYINECLYDYIDLKDEKDNWEKFLCRAKVYNENYWTNGCYVYVCIGEGTHRIYNGDVCGCEPVWDEIDPSTLGRSLPVKDSQGNRIFEGDIVKAFGGVHQDGAWEYEQVELIADISESSSYIFTDYDEVVVLGNIHENPELKHLISATGTENIKPF